MNEYLILLFFISLALAGLSVVALFSRSDHGEDRKEEEEKLGIAAP